MKHYYFKGPKQKKDPLGEYKVNPVLRESLDFFGDGEASRYLNLLKKTANWALPDTGPSANPVLGTVAAIALIGAAAAGTVYFGEAHAGPDSGNNDSNLSIPYLPQDFNKNAVLEQIPPAKNMKNEKLKIMSGDKYDPNSIWIDPMPSKSQIGRSDYNKPSKYELNKIVLELGSSTRKVYPKTQKSIQASLLVKNKGLGRNGDGQITMDYATVYAEGFGSPNILARCSDSLNQEEECEYRWELPLLSNPTEGIVNLMVLYGYSAEVSTNLASSKFGPLELSKGSARSEDVDDGVGKVNYPIYIYNRGKGTMSVENIIGIRPDGQEYEIISPAAGAYSRGEKRSFNITANKPESKEWQKGERRIKIEFTYKDAFAREIEIKAD